MTVFPVVLALLAATFWAAGMVVTKAGLRQTDLSAFALARWTFALIIFLVYGGATGTLHFPSAGLVGMAGLAGVVDSFLGGLTYLSALSTSPAHQVAPLANTAPFWGVVAAVVILGEHPSAIAFLAAALVVGGTVLLVPTRRAASVAKGSWRGPVLALITGLLWGFSEIGPARFCLDRGMEPVSFMIVFSAAAGLCWACLVGSLSRRRPLRVTGRGLGVAVVVAVLGSGLGWTLWLTGLRLAPASLLAPVRGATVLFSFLFSAVLLRERLTWRAGAGATLVFAGVFMVTTLS
ncbi:MAG: DMT family transporter [Candidatus Bipolaricaulaceae bacterium]